MRCTLLAIAAVMALPAVAPAADDAAHYWPQWRGPLGTGEAPHADPPVTWSETENVRFKVEIPGRGHSTPAVWGDRIYVTTAIDTRPQAQAEAAGDRPPPRTNDSPQQFVVMALDRGTGEVVWKKQVRESVPPEGTHADGSWASASPVTDGERIWVSFGSNGLYCLDAGGELVWETDLGDMQTRNGFGEGSSPVIYGDTLVLLWDHEGPSFIVGLDKNTGEERWRADRDERTSWSTPLVVERDGRAQAIVNATNLVRSYDVETGEVLWEVGGMTANAIPSPVHADGTVFVMSGFRGNALLAIRPGDRRGNLAGSEAIAWSYDQDTPYVPSPVLYDGALYFLKSNSGILSAFDTSTGQPRYSRQRTTPVQNVYASPVAAAGRIYIAGRDGNAVVIAHGPKYEVLGTNSLDDGFDASPVPVGDTLLLRGRRHLYAIAGD